MLQITETAVMDALRHVQEPELGGDLVTRNMVRDLRIDGAKVAFQIELTTPACPLKDEIESRVHAALDPLGVESVDLTWGATVRRATPRTPEQLLPGVKNVLAIASGKGGVGKSTVAVNLAIALARGGLRAGLLDADIYGPSLPILLGMEDGASRVRMSPEKHILPLDAFGVPMISFGFFLGEDSPAIWRGPMVSKAVKQFARGVAWPELDVLVVDLPPGTGDIVLSLAQSVVLSGAIVVTQPPRVAVAEARKAAQMFRTLEVPVLGVVENMSGPFGRGAGRDVARDLAVPFLGEVPFDPAIVDEGDVGIPTLVARPHGASASAFDEIARAVAGALGWRHADAVAREA